MGSKLSVPQQKYADELYQLVIREGYSISKDDVVELVLAIHDNCSWVPEQGTFSLQDWVKIGTYFQGHPEVSLSTLNAWRKVRAALMGFTPANILLAQQTPPFPLPQILPPSAPVNFPPLPATARPSYEQKKGPPLNKAEEPEVEASENSPSAPPCPAVAAPAVANPPPTGLPSTEDATRQYCSPVSEAIASNPELCVTHPVLAFPVLRVEGAQQKYQPVDQNFRDLAAQLSARNKQAHVTALSTLAEGAERPPDPISTEQYAGTGDYQTLDKQLTLSDAVLREVGNLVYKALVRVPSRYNQDRAFSAMYMPPHWTFKWHWMASLANTFSILQRIHALLFLLLFLRRLLFQQDALALFQMLPLFL